MTAASNGDNAAADSADKAETVGAPPRVLALWWRETLVLMGSSVAFAAFFALVVPLLSDWLNGSVLLGLPFGTFMTGGGTILVFLVIVFWYCVRQDRLDRAFDVADEEGQG